MRIPMHSLSRILLGTLLGWVGFAVVGAGVSLPGVARANLESELKGRILFEELNCVACHAGDPSLVARSKKAPRLAAVGSRIHPGYLMRFLADPHGVKPGTTMPDV